MRWSVTRGHRADDSAGAAVLHAAEGRRRAKRHHRALPHAEVAGAVVTAKASDAWISTKLAFEYVVPTASRSGEVRGAT